MVAIENDFSDHCGTRHCVGVANDTDALQLALGAVDIGPGGRVAMVANACHAFDHGHSRLWRSAGEHRSGSGHDADGPAGASAGGDRRNHLDGRMAPMPEVLRAANGVPVIEDCAQARGAELGGRKAGSWEIAGCFSFYPTKNLGALGDGGGRGHQRCGHQRGRCVH